VLAAEVKLVFSKVYQQPAMFIEKMHLTYVVFAKKL